MKTVTVGHCGSGPNYNRDNSEQGQGEPDFLRTAQIPNRTGINPKPARNEMESGPEAHSKKIELRIGKHSNSRGG